MKSLIFIIAVIASTHAFYSSKLGENVPFSLCDASVDGKVVKITSIDASNVVPGQTGTFTVTGTALSAVTIKQINFKVQEGLPLAPVSLNRSFTAGQNVTIKMDQPIPSFVPAGTYHLSIESVDNNNQHVDCVQLAFTIQAAASQRLFMRTDIGKFDNVVRLNANLPFDVCDASVDGKNLKVNNIDVENLAPGQKCTVTVNATAIVDVTVAKVRMTLSTALPIPLPDVDVNKSAKAGETVSITVSQELPSFVPHGTYNVKSTSLDASGNHVDCVAFTITI